MTTPDAGHRQIPFPPMAISLIESPIKSPIADSKPPSPPYDPYDPHDPHPLATSSALAKANTFLLASTASSLRGGVGFVRARLQDRKSSIGSWSKGTQSRPPIPSRPSMEGMLPE
jgi:hypothetical protein